MKKIGVLILVLIGIFLQACGGGSSAASVMQTTAPTISYKFSSDYNTSIITITNNMSGATIRYTTDGTEPTISSKEYTGTFNITVSDQIVKAKAFKDGLTDSDTISESIPVGKKPLTIMYYGDADNNLEPYLLADIEEMKDGFDSNANYNVITLFDRIPSYSNDSSVFEENFEDTRLYKIGEGTTTRLSGWNEFPEINRDYNYEANMGDAKTLKKFIQYCKANYPADKYVLIISNHGGGTRSVKSTSSSITKDICEDVTSNGDIMYTGEISDVLTSNESVDVMVLDACLMGSVEFAYQFRNDSSNTGFKSDYMVASPALVWGYGLPYDSILGRLKSSIGNNGTVNSLGGGTETYIVPSSTINMAEFSKMTVEEQYDDTSSQTSETFSAYDLSKVTALKTAIDNFAKTAIQSTLEGIRGNSSAIAMNYMTTGWYSDPFFDIYDLMRKYNTEESNTVLIALDDVILTSFGGTDFYNVNDSIKFTNNLNGMHIVFPKSGYASYFGWYSPESVTGSDSYGKLSFCSDGTKENTAVESWFEMIDKWYDDISINSGRGYNYYKY